MSSTPMMKNILNVVQSEATKANSSSSSAISRKNEISAESKFKEILANALQGEGTVKQQGASEPVKNKIAKTTDSDQDVNSGRDSSGAGLEPNWSLSLLQAAMTAVPGQKPSGQGAPGENNSLYSEDALESGLGKTGGKADVFMQSDVSDGLGKNGKGLHSSLKGIGKGGGTIGALLGQGALDTTKNQALDEMLSDLWNSIYNKTDIIQANSLDAAPSTQVVLSNEWTPGNLAAPLSLNGEGAALGSPLKSIQSALGDYWVPPVQVTTQSPTQATVQVSLRGGGTLTLQLEISNAQNVALRIEAPAAALAELQSRLAPLQAAFLQQGLTLAPIQWGLAKSSTGRVTSSSESEKEYAVGERTVQMDSEASSSNLLAGSAVPAASFVEDLLE